MPSHSHIQRVYSILEQREAARMYHASHTHPSEAHSFYSVDNSLKHRRHNRYHNILAYDRTAVLVEGHYLNANVVKDGKGGVWIAAQAPPPGAFDTFFKAMYTGAASGKRPTDVVCVQLTGFEERGIIKADPYMNHKATGITLDTLRRDHVEGISSIVTEVELQGNGHKVNLHHYHFDAWPDHGVPKGTGKQALSVLLREIDDKRQALGCEVWVHCSAGVGRTGTFIALSSLLSRGEPEMRSPLGPLPTEIAGDTVAATVDAIRECRTMLVQNEEQLKFVYEMVKA